MYTCRDVWIPNALHRLHMSKQQMSNNRVHNVLYYEPMFSEY